MESNSGKSGAEQEQGVRSLLVSSLEFIAFNAGRYTYRKLATLPRHLRIHVLRLMSVVEICGVEESAMCADITLNDHVWRFVGERHIQLGEPMGIPIPLRDLEDMFHALGDRRLAWNEKEWTCEFCKDVAEFSKERYLNAITSCLFSSQDMLRNAAISVLFSPGVSFYEDRKTTMNTVSEEHLLETLFYDCHFFPSIVYIDCTDLMHTGIWMGHQMSFWIVRRALCRVKQLTVSLTGPCRVSTRVRTEDVPEVIHLFRFIIEAVFARDNQGHLGITHITVKGDVECLSKALDHLADFLTERSGAVATFMNSPLNSQYDGLKFFSVELNSEGLGNDEALMNTLHANMRQVIMHQSVLCKLCIVGWCTSIPIGAQSEYERLLQCVSKLFRNPIFKELLLETHLYCNCDGHEINMKGILKEFLSSPIEKQAFKAYCIIGNPPDKCSDFCRQSFTSACVSYAPVKHKHLCIIEESMTLWFDKFLTNCLLDHSAYQNLSEIVLEGVEDISDDILIGIKPLRLKSFKISSPCEDIMASISIEALVQIFTMPCLEALVLYDVVYGDVLNEINPKSPSRLIQAIVHGLWKQVAIGKLVRLDLSRNCLGTGKFDYLREMFQALFALPQLSSTSVFIHDNYFKREHFELMCMAWQLSAQNQRLLQLGASSIKRETQIHLRCKKLNDVAYVIT